jgi:putative acetyltransferase
MISIRPQEEGDGEAVARLIERAFGGKAEARLVKALLRDGDCVLSLVAISDGVLCGQILFSRLTVVGSDGFFPALALAPLSVEPRFQRRGMGTALVERAHRRLRQKGETLSVVLGEPSYYGRFGYRHDRAAGFESDYQCDALQALAWGEAPSAGRLAYAPAFAEL